MVEGGGGEAGLRMERAAQVQGFESFPFDLDSSDHYGFCDHVSIPEASNKRMDNVNTIGILIAALRDPCRTELGQKQHRSTSSRSQSDPPSFLFS